MSASEITEPANETGFTARLHHPTAFYTGVTIWGLVVLGALLAWLLGDNLLYIVQPCLFHEVTGLHCMGCGATRCTLAYARGDLDAAFSYNVLFAIALPLILLWTLDLVRVGVTGRRFLRWRMRWWGIAVIMLVGIVFMVLRNLPIESLRWLAP